MAEKWRTPVYLFHTSYFIIDYYIITQLMSSHAVAEHNTPFLKGRIHRPGPIQKCDTRTIR